jgi:hypothetical protein
MNRPLRSWLTTLSALPLAACSGASFLAANIRASFEPYDAVRDLAYGDSARRASMSTRPTVRPVSRGR